MKRPKLKFITLGFLILNPILFAQSWEKIEPTFDPPGTYHFGGGEFFDEYNGWAFADSGKVLNTTDGGKNWRLAFQKSNYFGRDIFKLNDNIGWILLFRSDSSLLMKTTDGGKNWEEIFMPFSTHRVYFTDENTGFTKGDSNFFRTSNGGYNWEEVKVDTDKIYYNYTEFYFLNKEKGWFIATNGEGPFTGDPESYLLKTNDGGMNWKLELFPLDRGNGYWNIVFIDTSNGILTEFMGGNFYTTDGGKSWIKSEEFYAGNLIVGFSNDGLAWSAGIRGRINYSADSGKTWHRTDSLTSNTLNDICFVENTGYLFGGYNTLLKYDSIVGVKENNYNPIAEFMIKSHPNPVNSQTNITFSLPQSAHTLLTIYNITGEKVKTIYNGHLSKGEYSFSLSLNELASGLYLCNLRQADNSKTIKILLLK